MVICCQNIWFNKKKRTQTSTEMGIGCQRNGHWHGPWHWAATQSSVSRLRQGGVPEGAVH